MPGTSAAVEWNGTLHQRYCSAHGGSRHDARRLELPPQRLTDLRENARVPCEARDPGGHAGGREEADDHRRARARRPRHGEHALRRQGQARRPRGSQEGQARQGHAAGALAGAHRQPAGAHPQEGADAPGGLRRGDVQAGAGLASPPLGHPAGLAGTPRLSRLLRAGCPVCPQKPSLGARQNARMSLLAQGASIEFGWIAPAGIDYAVWSGFSVRSS